MEGQENAIQELNSDIDALKQERSKLESSSTQSSSTQERLNDINNQIAEKEEELNKAIETMNNLYEQYTEKFGNDY